MDKDSTENTEGIGLVERNRVLSEEVTSLREALYTSQQALADNRMQIDILLRQIERLRYDGKIDKMTNLFNNNYLEDRDVISELESLSREGIYFGIIFIDLNDLKKINDSEGHKQGDEYIVASSRSLVESVSVRDTVVRKGGDEFVVIVRHITEEYAGSLGDKISDRIKTSLSNKGISASLGFALSSECGHSLEDTVNLSDRRMYLEKKESKR